MEKENQTAENIEQNIDDEIGHPTNSASSNAFFASFIDNSNISQPSATSSIPTSLFSSPEIAACLEKAPEIIDCFLLSETDENECFMSARTPESFLNVPPGPNPMDYNHIRQLQQNDNRLQQLRTLAPAQHPLQPFNNVQLICFRPTPQSTWKICIPDIMLTELITWYHNVLLHVGEDRLTSSIATHFFHPQLDKRVKNFVSRCQHCQQYKRPGHGYGHLAPRECAFQPFTEVAVDTIGPWKVRVNNELLTFQALTTIDTVSNLVELVRVETKTGREVSRKFEHSWLYRYPRPNCCIHDAGPKFNNHDFQFLLTEWGIDGHPISVRNPQANAVCERMHQTVANLISIFVHTNPPQTPQDAQNIVEDALASASHAYRSTIHTTLGISPGALVFNRDMLLDIPFVADLITLRNKRQLRIDENLRKENNRRRDYDYNIGDRVYELVEIKNPLTSKIRTYAQGPYDILCVHTNGTLTIRRTNQVIDRVNIRRLRPAIFGPPAP